MTGLLDKLTLLVLTTLFVAVASAALRAEVLFWPYTLDGASGYLGPIQPSTRVSTGAAANAADGPDLQSVSSLAQWQWDDLSSVLSGNPGEIQGLKGFRTIPEEPANYFLLGGGRLGIETEKNVRSDPLRRNECTMDEDDCMDNSGLPKTGPGKRNLKTLRKPYIGLSITRPLQ